MSAAHRDEIRDRVRERYGCSNEQFDALVRYFGGPANDTLGYTKAARAARGSQGDGTFVMAVHAFLAGWDR